jgi:uncharacterized protein YhaN
MRLNSLKLRPYGSLSDAALELGEDLTVVYGLNEAGKSTMQSAYADLLCGIPRQTPMAFLVPRAKLCIHATVTMDDGSTVTVIRTPKKAPNDLIDAATSNPVSAEVRQRLTQVLDHSCLMTQFGLNHDRLVTGGQRLMKGHGGLADIVFEARSGTDVRVLVDRLDGQAAELYTPRSNSTSALIRANTRREQLDRELQETLATAEAVDAAVTRRDQAAAELQRRRLEAAHLRTEPERLTKLIDSLPYWEKYRARRDELAQAKASGPRLSSDQFKAVTAAVTRLDQIDGEIRQQNQVAATAQSERSGLAADEDLLGVQPAIDTLSKQKYGAEAARTRVAELGRDATKALAELVKLLGRLGLGDDADPVATLATIAIPDDRAADLHSLAAEGDRIDDNMQKAQQSVNDAAAAVAAAERAAETASHPSERTDSVDPTQVRNARAQREALWGHVRRSWLTGIAVPAELCSGPDDLANRYEASVADADGAANELVAQAGRLSQEQRGEIEAAASAEALVNERRAALSKAKQALNDVKQSQEDLLSRWQAVAEAVGLPNNLGIRGWRERAELLSEAQAAAESLSDLQREQALQAQTVADWNAAVSSLASDLGRPVVSEQLVAWFDEIKAAYEQAKSNQKAAEVHCKAEDKALKRVAQLRDERTELEQTLDRVAAARDVDRSGLDDLVERTEIHADAVAALESPEAQLRATHPGTTLSELVNQLADTDRGQLEVDVDAAKEALAQAEEAVNVAQEDAIDANNALDELTGRTGADALQQQLSQATALVLEIVEDCATTRLMQYLLTQELRSYLESHRNPVLERAGSYLSRLTQGRFTRLRAEGEGTDRSLVVIGADAEDYDTTALSEGTASQLYLALSLAGVLEVEQERRQAGQETVPIMLDDVLMAFDDQRAASALDLLAEIGKEQQIVLFTHHAAVKEQAGSITGTARVISLAQQGFPV